MKPVSNRRLWIARGVALAGDALQLAFFPLFGEGFASPANWAVDIVVCALLTWLVGFHIAFLPSFLVEEVPLLNLAPTWTAAVLVATRKRARLAAGSPPPAPPAPPALGEAPRE